MKIYIQYKETSEDESMKTKLSLNSKWSTGPVSAVKKLFITAYNKKYTESSLSLEHTTLYVGCQKCYDDDIVEKVIEDSGTFIVKIEDPPERIIKKEDNHEGMVQCKNYGCMKWYKPEENVEGCCRHHVGPPIFHDTKKGWSCCEKRVYDWNDFHKIEGCVVGKHNPTQPEVTYAPSPTLEAFKNIETKTESNISLKSISDFNNENPNAPTAVSSLIHNTVEPVPMKDGKCRCLHHGCQQWYDPNDNTSTSCHYHKGNPYFHDGAKSWTCCSKEVMNFDDFMAIPTCSIGYHYDGRGEELN